MRDVSKPPIKKEETAKQEEQALEKIAAILAALTSKRIAMVSEASINMQDKSMQQSKELQLEMRNMQQVSKDATKEVNECAEKVKSHFMERMFSASGFKAAMENCLQKCSRTVDYSRQQWENAQLSLINLHNSSLAEIESTVKKNILTNCVLHQEFVSASLSMDTDYDAGTHYLLADVNDSLMLDHNNKKEIDSMTTRWLEQLNFAQEKHGESISSIHVQAEKCLVKNYWVDQSTSSTSQKRTVAVPSPESIEQMRTQIIEDISLANRSKWIQAESKIPRLAASPNRTPFAEVN